MRDFGKLFNFDQGTYLGKSMDVCDECYFSNRAPKIIVNEISHGLLGVVMGKIQEYFRCKDQIFFVVTEIGQMLQKTAWIQQNAFENSLSISLCRFCVIKRG